MRVDCHCHIFDNNCVPVRYANGLTEEQVMDLLAQDLERLENCVDDNVNVDLTQNQLSILWSRI